MALIGLHHISLAYGGPLLFDDLSLQLERGERVALLGRNGAGKSTLMKVMAGATGVDSGEVIVQQGVKVSYLPQEVPVGLKGPVVDIVYSGLGERGKVLHDYHELNHRLATEHSPALMNQLDKLQHKMEEFDCWSVQEDVDDRLTHMSLDGEEEFSQLSGGQKRRALLAKALMQAPDILLLDEPTNHLDIDAIDWLEQFLLSFEGTVVFITHDRMFMQKLATRIVELDRGAIYSWACDYPTFLERKQQALEAEAAQQENFDKKLAKEEVWIRKGIKARRTRNEGRVKALEKMRAERRARRETIGQVRMSTQVADRSGQMVIRAKKISYRFDKEILIKDFSTEIMRGDKIGVIGANGSGKTTLLRLLLGKLPLQEGTVDLGTNLQVTYFDQLREHLDEEKTVIENITDNTDTVMVNGQRRHVIGYLQDFLFSPERARTPVKVLSGGERNRLLLARHFTKPANVLVMDEPTNDLDVETLELLEELLIDYPGTLLLVSHDRAFLNNVVTSTIVLEGKGVIREYPGGYDDWLNQRHLPLEAEMGVEPKATPPSSGRELSRPEQQELGALPKRIEKLEAEQLQLADQMAEPSFYEQKDAARIAQATKRAGELTAELQEAYRRWEYLEALRNQ